MQPTPSEKLFSELPKQLEISIELHDINAGVTADCRECPTALAALRTMRILESRTVTVSVGSISVMFGFDGVEPRHRLRVCYVLPAVLRKWVRNFDHCQQVKPIKAQLPKSNYHLVAFRDLSPEEPEPVV